ncbi:MAG TPA: hypothetical protein VGN38_02300 [Caulobacteraceae bacterium]|jgi:hypothetical protein|nr:hypothetical protein [Caulobacteraceae bacterium]
MKAVPRRARHGPILRPRRWRGWAIFIVLLVLATAGSLLAAIAGGADWTQGALEGRADHGLVVTVWGRGLESADAAAARANEILQGQFGAGRVEWLEPDPRDRLLAELAGAPADQQAGARVLRVRGLGADGPARLRSILAANRLAASAGQASGGRSWRLAILAIAVASAAIAVAMAALILWTARGEVTANAEAVRLMLRMGAERGRIAGLARARGLALIFASTLVGEALAALAVAVWARKWPDQGFGLTLRGPQLPDVFWTGEFAVAAIILGLFAAWLGARGAVRRLA